MWHSAQRAYILRFLEGVAPGEPVASENFRDTPEERAAKRRRADAGDAARAMDAEDPMYELG